MSEKEGSLKSKWFGREKSVGEEDKDRGAEILAKVL